LVDPLEPCERKCSPRSALLLAFTVLTACSPPLAPQRQQLGTIVARFEASAPTLRSSSGRLELTLDVVTKFPEAVPAFSYAGRIGAPTLRVSPGDVLIVHLRNRLTRESDTRNAVNLHFHGLDVSPGFAEDDTQSMLAMPGQSLEYDLHIPAAQQPGLYWYHPHSHGEAYWQVVSGMSGAIVVGPSLQPREQSDAILILRDLQESPDILHVPWLSRPGTTKMQLLLAKKLGFARYAPRDPNDSPPGQPCAQENGMFTSVQGTDRGTLSIPSGQRKLIRVINASPARVYDLVIDHAQLGVVGIDGYPVASFPGNAAVRWVNHFALPPGGRVEFLAVGTATPMVLRSKCYDSGSAGDRNPEVILATLIQGSSTAAKTVAQTEKGTPRVVPIGLPTRRRQVLFTEDNSGYYINHERFSMSLIRPMFTVHIGTVEEWTIVNDTDEIHAFHIHQIHFVVTKINGIPVKWRTWQDTAIVPPLQHRGRHVRPGSITLLADFRSPLIRGLFPFHCHMLDHEDGGMMALVRAI
jgi:suppressor of ftsI